MVHSRCFADLRALFACLVMCAAVCLPAVPAAAQGTDGMFPAPITTLELADYFLRLNASPEQQQAIMRAHDRYQAEFRRLRETDLQRVMDQMMQLQQPLMPDPRDVAAMARAMESGGQQIVRVDNRFFDEVQSLLAPSQGVRMARIRQARERVRAVSGSFDMMMNGIEGLELETTLRRRGIDPAAAGNEAIDAILDTYERRLTMEVTKLAKLAGSFMFDIVEVLEAAGIEPGTNLMEDPEQMTRLMEASQSFMADRMHGQQQAVRDMRALAMVAAGQISSMMDPVDAAGIRRAIIGEIHSELNWGFIAYMGNTDFLWNVERMAANLDEDAKQRVLGMTARIGPRIDRMIDQALEVISERDSSVNMFEFDAETWQAFHDRINAIQKQAQELYGELAVLLDEIDKEAEAGTSWRIRLSRMTSGGAESPEIVEVAATDADSVADESRHWGGDWAIPQRMGRIDVRHLSTLLSMDEGEASILDQLHADYIEAYQAIEPVASVRSMSSRLWAADAQSGEGPLDEDGINRLRTERRRAVDAVRAVDEAFLESVSVMAGTPERDPLIAAFRDARLLTLYMRGPHIWISPAQQESQEWQVNPMMLVLRDRTMHADERTSVAEHFLKTSGSMVDIARRQFEAGLDAQYRQDRWHIRQRSGEAGAVDYNVMRRELAGPVATMTGLRGELMTLNANMIEAICADLSPDSADRIRGEYRRRAYPNIYAGFLDVEPFIRRALALHDLSGAKREAIQELLATFKPRLDQFSDEMLEITRAYATQRGSTANAASDDQMNEWRSYAEFNRSIERLRHDRNELIYRSLLELRAQLTPDQIASVGPMPDLAALVGQ